jgi:glycosyltransferase involved in cell wall biosynthesis
VSEFSKKDIIDQYGIDEKKINVVFSGVKDIFKPVSPQVKYEIKKQYTGGAEFFLHTGAIHPRKNLENLLKAFSIFKKRQQSSMKLVLAGRLAWKYNSLTEKLKTYKYRNEVILLDYVDEDVLTRLTASAYALIYPSFFEGFGVPVLEAMQCEVPVITSNGSSMQEIGGDAALYAKPDNYMELAETMMHLYKNETLRSSLIIKGSEVVSQYTWDKTSKLLWRAIQKSIV